MVHTSRGGAAFWGDSYSSQLLMLSSQHLHGVVLIEYLFKKCQNDPSGHGECNVTTRSFFPFFSGCFLTLTPVSNEQSASCPGHAVLKGAWGFKSSLGWSSSGNTVPLILKKDPSRMDSKRMGPFLTTAPAGTPKDRAGGMSDTLSIFHWCVKNTNVDLRQLFANCGLLWSYAKNLKSMDCMSTAGALLFQKNK